MEEIVKHINDTNASYRQPNAGNAKNTDLFLDSEHYLLFKDCGEQITVRYNKENLAKAILFIASILPRKYDQSTTHKLVEFSKEFVLDQLAILDALFTKDGKEVSTFTQIWNARKDVDQKNGKVDKRFYFNGLLKDVTYTDSLGFLRKTKFTIRNYLAGGFSNLHISKADDGIFDIRISNANDSTYDNNDAKVLKVEPVASDSPYRPYLTAIKSKPFLLLAGISGTGKSRIVRELARACWEVGSDEYRAQKPSNFEMVQVKPNWHDSSELIGYVSRINGEKYIVGPFLKFLVKALQNPEIPHFLCLDEMNLAPVEQYFAEYLSVVESRRVNEDGEVETDPIVDFEATDAYKSLIDQLFVGNEDERGDYLTEENGKRLTLPANLIVVGTVNMDETTFSFSRKVLDRAMTIEMNEVDLYGGLLERHEPIGKIGCAELTGRAVEGADVYRNHQEVCDMALEFLGRLNRELESTPFKVAYRTRNEFLLYVVNNLPYNRDVEGNELPQGYVVARALDEITCMKVLSRIEGDETKVQDALLDKLMAAIEAGLKEISDEAHPVESVSLRKLREMKQRLASGYTSFWS